MEASHDARFLKARVVKRERPNADPVWENREMFMRVGFLGTGAITSAMVTGLSATKGEYEMVLSPRNAVVAADLARRFPSVAIASSNQAVLDACETVVIAVRPQIAEEVLKELRFSADHSVVSVVSGFPVARLARLAGVYKISVSFRASYSCGLLYRQCPV